MNQTTIHRCLSARLCFACCPAALTLLSIGCASTTTSNTARTATEQLLISDAIDRSMSAVRFDEMEGYSVFVNDKYLDGTVDKGYIVGSLRHRVLQAGGVLATDAAAADLVLEVRSGGVGTDLQESFVGIPAIGIPGLPIELPEVKVASRNTQMGTAKLGLVCYDAKTGAPVGLGGDSTALAHNNDTYVLGIGPFRSGSVRDQREKAVGFNGVGGGVFSSRSKVVTGRPVSMVTKPTASYDDAPQIATLPESMQSVR